MFRPHYKYFCRSLDRCLHQVPVHAYKIHALDIVLHQNGLHRIQTKEVKHCISEHWPPSQLNHLQYLMQLLIENRNMFNILWIFLINGLCKC